VLDGIIYQVRVTARRRRGETIPDSVCGHSHLIDDSVKHHHFPVEMFKGSQPEVAVARTSMTIRLPQTLPVRGLQM